LDGLHLGGVRKILCLGAHADDIEIGAGGTLMSIVAADADISVDWVVFSADGDREVEARQGAERILTGCRDWQVHLFHFRDGYFPYMGPEVKDCFEELKKREPPDLIFTHFRDDLHQDHRLVSELTWNTFRDHTVLEYEIPKFDGGLGSPNVFVELDEALLGRKVDVVMDVYATQRARRWFRRESFEALPRLRGIECNARHGVAEAFYCRKLRLDFPSSAT
jgi:LmbE family N-acetylglucosaminyl deacetylase